MATAALVLIGAGLLTDPSRPMTRASADQVALPRQDGTSVCSAHEPIRSILPDLRKAERRDVRAQRSGRSGALKSTERGELSWAAGAGAWFVLIEWVGAVGIVGLADLVERSHSGRS